MLPCACDACSSQANLAPYLPEGYILPCTVDLWTPAARLDDMVRRLAIGQMTDIEFAQAMMAVPRVWVRR